VLVSLVALARGASSLWPPLSISAQTPMIATEALSSPFEIKNLGSSRVEKVMSVCVLNHVEGLLRIRGAYSDNPLVDTPSVVEGLVLIPDRPQFESLMPGQSLTTSCNVGRGFTGPLFPIHDVTAAEIILEVYYQPHFLPRWHIFQGKANAEFQLLPRRGSTFRWSSLDVPVPKPYSVSPVDPFRDTALADPLPGWKWRPNK
jgi:hypothetical protein